MNKIWEIGCSFKELLWQGNMAGITDIHIKTNEPISYRKDGSIRFQSDFLTDSKTISAILREMKLSPAQYRLIAEAQDFDIDASFSYAETNGRINIYSDSSGISIAIRLLPANIPTMESLRLPLSVKKFANLKHGFVIISGPTGSGKSSTLASIINTINKKHAMHIITIEDPIEYRFRSEQSLITQREVYTHCESFAKGLKSALRQDPDIIMVGEMRDAETISTALQAAETGHLVFSTLHAGTAVEALDRLTQYFPDGRHAEIRASFANCFQGIVAQRLIPSIKGNSEYERVAAFEVVLPSDAIRNVIRTGINFRIRDYMSRSEGMISMEDSLQGLRNKMLIR